MVEDVDGSTSGEKPAVSKSKTVRKYLGRAIKRYLLTLPIGFAVDVKRKEAGDAAAGAVTKKRRAKLGRAKEERMAREIEQGNLQSHAAGRPVANTLTKE